jgi:superfamily II DNA or RNA helicase
MDGVNLNVAWSKPYKNNKVWMRDWEIPQSIYSDFFKYWKVNGNSLKLRGYSVSKKNELWYLHESKTTKKAFGLSKKEPVNTPYTPVALIPVKIKDPSGLRPWQIEMVEKLVSIINANNCAIDGSDTGVGKSYVSCGVARELNLNILVVCPKAVMESWRRVICNHFKMKDNLVGIINYELLRRGRTDNEFASYVKRRDTCRKEFVWKLPKNTLIVWDESQKLKGSSTKNSETCISAFKQGYKMLFCSATNATNPLELKTVGTALKLFNNNREYYLWLYEHGVVKGRFGLEFKGGRDVLNKLHKDIFIDRGVRLSRDVIPNFPASQIIADCYDMGEQAKNKINSIYTEMSKELNRLKSKSKAKSLSVLTTILRARQEIELVKVPLFIEMIEEGLEDGMSVVVFVNFTETIHALATRLNTRCIVNGEAENQANRQQNIDDFQDDKSRVILVNIAAGGAGLSLHDLTGNHPRLALISPSYSAVQMRQSTGRVWRDGAKSKSLQKIVFVANTVEEKVCDSVKLKLENLDTLNDGDLNL